MHFVSNFFVSHVAITHASFITSLITTTMYRCQPATYKRLLLRTSMKIDVRKINYQLDLGLPIDGVSTMCVHSAQHVGCRHEPHLPPKTTS